MYIGFKEYILREALKSIEDKSLINYINNIIKNKDYSNIIYRLNKALYSLK